MKSLLNNFRVAVVALSSISVVAPSAVWAKTQVANRGTSQARLSSSMTSTPVTIRSSNGRSSDKISNLSVSSAIFGNSQSGGGHPHKPSNAGATVGNGISRVSQLKSPWDSTVLPAGGGNVKGVPNVRSAQVMDLWGQLGKIASDPVGALGQALDDATGNSQSGGDTLTNGTGGPPAPYPIHQPAPGSGYMASIANTNAKFFDHKALIRSSDRNLVSKEIEKKYYDTHPSAQTKLVK
jgi:hypothetical protein